MANFRPATVKHGYYCSECGMYLTTGKLCQELVVGGKVKKRLCDKDECRRRYEDREWASHSRRKAKVCQ